MGSVNMNKKPHGEQKQIILCTDTDSVEELLYVDQVGKHRWERQIRIASEIPDYGWSHV